jgi:hypothetical protein
MTPRRRCVITRPLIMALLLLAATGAVAPTHAEPTVVPPSIGDAFNPDLRMRDVSLFERHLSLDDIQTSLLRTLFEEYQLTFTERITEVRRQMVTGDPSADELQTARRRLVAFAQQQRDALLEELTLLQSQMGVESNSQEIMAQIALRVSEIKALLAAANQPSDSSVMLHAMPRSPGRVLDAWRAEKEQLVNELFENIRAICTVEQLEHWPAVMRALRREQALVSSNGRLSGESVDLFKLLRQIDLSPDAAEAMQDTVDVFARQIDQAIIARDSFIRSNRAALDEAQQVQDEARARTILQQEMQLRKALRDVSNEMLDALVPVLGEALAGELVTLVRQHGYALVYRPTYADQVFQRILADLPADHPLRLEVEELADSHAADLEQANARLYALLLREEPAAALARSMRPDRPARRNQRRRGCHRHGDGSPQHHATELHRCAEARVDHRTDRPLFRPTGEGRRSVIVVARQSRGSSPVPDAAVRCGR